MTLLLKQLGSFLVMLAVGFFLVRRNWLSSKDFEAFSRLVVKILLPLFLLTTIPAAGTRADLLAFMPVLLLAFAAIIILLALGVLSARLARLPDSTARTHVVCNAISNIGFMGIPIGAALFGAPGILAASLYVVANDTIMWTLGRAIMTKRLNFGLEKTAGPTGGARTGIRLKGMINTNFLMVMAGIVLLALEINPAGNLVWDTLAGIGGLCRYLPMVIIGGFLGSFDFRNLRRYAPALLIVLIKMLLFPIAVALLLGLLLPDMSLVSTSMLVIGIALPTFSTSAAAAATYGVDSQYAAGCTTITTLFSMITLPMILFVVSL